MKKTTALLTVVCFIAVSGIAFAKGKGMFTPPGKWWKKTAISESLNLTDDEKAKLDEMHLQFRQRMIELKANMDRENLGLETIMEQENLDESACMDSFMKVQDARTKLAAERFSFFLGVRKLLGYERSVQLKEKASEMKMKRKRMWRGKKQMQGNVPPPPAN